MARDGTHLVHGTDLSYSSKASTRTRAAGKRAKTAAAVSIRASCAMAREQRQPYFAFTRSLATLSAVRLRAKKSESG